MNINDILNTDLYFMLIGQKNIKIRYAGFTKDKRYCFYIWNNFGLAINSLLYLTNYEIEKYIQTNKLVEYE